MTKLTLHSHKNYNGKVYYFSDSALDQIKGLVLLKFELLRGILFYFGTLEKRIILPITRKGWSAMFGICQHFGCPENLFRPIVYGDYVRLATDGLRYPLRSSGFRWNLNEATKILKEQAVETIKTLSAYGLFPIGEVKIYYKQSMDCATLGWKSEMMHRSIPHEVGQLYSIKFTKTKQAKPYGLLKDPLDQVNNYGN